MSIQHQSPIQRRSLYGPLIVVAPLLSMADHLYGYVLTFPIQHHLIYYNLIQHAWTDVPWLFFFFIILLFSDMPLFITAAVAGVVTYPTPQFNIFLAVTYAYGANLLWNLISPSSSTPQASPPPVS